MYHLPKISRPRTLFLLATVSVIFCGVFAVPAATLEAPPVKRVLILHSFGREFAPFNAASSSFRTELARHSSTPIEFMEASLETARFAEGGSETPFVEYLRALFADRPPDLLVPFGAPAMNFLVRHREELFPGVPLLVGTVDRRRLTVVNLGANATAVGTDLDLPAVVENILRILPGTTNIEVVIGNSPLERFWLVELREDFAPFNDRVRFNWLNELSFEQMRQRVATLPPDTAVLFAVLLVDAAGVPHEQERALEVLRRDGNAAIFGAFENQLGRGIVGGPLYRAQQVGREAARFAVRILNGESPGSIQPVMLGPAAPVYDWRELKRWNIGEERLPPGSIVQFREPSLWGRYRWYVMGALVLFSLQAALIAGLVFSRIKRRRAETELREGQELMDMAANAGGLGLWARDLKGDGVWANSVLRSLFGFGRNDPLRAGDLFSRIHPDDSVRVMAEVQRTQETGTLFEGEFRALLPDDRERWILAKGRTIEEPSGRRVRRMGVLLDITDRKKMEGKLRESEEMVKKEHSFLRQVIDIDPNFIFAKDREGRFTLANQAVADAYGTTVENLVGKTDADFNANIEELEFFRRLDQEVIDTNQERFIPEERITDARGNVRWLQTVKRPIVMSDGKAIQVLGSATDITERKRAEERFRLAVEASPNAIVMVNERGEIVLVNALTERLFGYDRDELIGQSAEILVPERFRANHPAHRQGFFAAPQTRAMGAGRDLFARRKDGTEFLVEIGLNPIQTSDGVFVLTAIVDITERKRADSELQRNREELAHVTRVSAMGELAASLAHELNQPLTAILSNAQAAQRFLSVKPTDMEEIKDILKDIVEDNSRAGEVIRRMRALVKKEDLAFVVLDLAGVIRDVMQLVHSDGILRNIRVELESQDGLPSVRGDKIQLQQVMLNLFLNAFDAMKDCPADKRQVLVRVDSDGVGMVEVSVCDHGMGLTSEKLNKIFQPFFTTKRDGLGMGLSISRSIVERHGGRLWAENNQDRGATFHMVLPAFIDAGAKVANDE